MNSLDERQLECFIAVAQEGHLGRAAARLRMTQPPLTRRIARLEHEVGARLFRRSHLGVELTDAGEVLLERALRIVQLSDQAVVDTRLAAEGRLGSLAVGYVGAAAFGEIPELLHAFVRAQPGVDLRLEQASKLAQIGAVRDGRLHLGLGRYHTAEPDLAVVRVSTGGLQVAIPEDSPLTVHSEVTFTDLNGADLVVFPAATRPGFADHVLTMCSQAGLPITPYRIADDVVTALCYVSISGAYAIVPGAATRVALPRVAYRPLAGSPPEEVSCLYRSADTPPPARAFLRFLQRRLKASGQAITPGDAVPASDPTGIGIGRKPS